VFIQLFNEREGVSAAGQIFPCVYFRRDYPSGVEEYATFIGIDGRSYTAWLHEDRPECRVFNAMEYLAEIVAADEDGES